MSPRALARFLSRFGSLRGSWQALRFAGIHVGAGARLSVDGEFSYGRGCSIGTGSNIIVPKHSLLRMGDQCHVGRNVELGPSGRMEIGDGTSVQDRSVFLGEVSLGRYCTLSYNIYMSSGQHYFQLLPYELVKDQDRYAQENADLAASHNRPIIVEDDCWLGFNVAVMPGVRLGKGAVVGANSVVTKDVAPYSVVAGAPAKLIKERLAFLPPRQIAHTEPAHLPYFYSGFAISRAERTAHAPVGGLVVKGKGVLALDPSGGEFLWLSAKSLNGGAMTLVFGDQRAELTTEFREIRFRLADAVNLGARLTVGAEPSDALWAVEKAWIR